MHIPDGILSVPVSATGFGAAGLGLAWASRFARSSTDERLVPTAGIAGAFVFAAQMVQIPIPMVGATSGHLVGGALMAMLLGLPLAVLVMSAVLVVQCFLFQDGGLMALGANITNMGVIGPLIGWAWVRAIRPKRRGSLVVTAFLAGWSSLVAAGVTAGLEIGLSSTIPASTAAWGMGVVHAAIGLLEGVVTAAVVVALTARNDIHLALEDLVAQDSSETQREGLPHRKTGWPAWVLVASGATALFCGLVLAQFSSSLPDGLQSFLARFGLHEGNHMVPSFMPDYQVRWLAGWPGRLLAALVGVLGTTLLAAGLVKLAKVAGLREKTSHGAKGTGPAE